MARKPGTRASGEFVMFNVIYEDDTQRSNRRVPAELLGGLVGDEPARNFIQQQDQEISEKSGLAPMKIKLVIRTEDHAKMEAKEREKGQRRANSR